MQAELERVERAALFVVCYTQPRHRRQKKVPEDQDRSASLEHVHFLFPASTAYITGEVEAPEGDHRLVLVPHRNNSDSEACQVGIGSPASRKVRWCRSSEKLDHAVP